MIVIRRGNGLYLSLGFTEEWTLFVSRIHRRKVVTSLWDSPRNGLDISLRIVDEWPVIFL